MSGGTTAAATQPLTCQRELFDLPADVHYLNCAYMGPLPRASLEAGIAGMRLKSVPTAIEPVDFFDVSDELRVRFARLVGSPEPTRIAIQPAVSYGVATVARNLPLLGDQNVVITHEQFPGNVYAWLRKAGEVGAEVRRVAAGDEPGRGARWNERLLDAIDGGTAVVSVPHVHWTDGTRFDLEAIGERCRAVGAALVLDVTQSLGALPLDLEAVRPDAVLCAAYKWLLGPYSVAMAYFGDRFADGVPLEETWIGREHSEDFQHLVDYQDRYQPGAIRYDVGERANFALLPVAVSSLGLLAEWRPERIQEYCRRLTAELLDDARSLGFSVESEAWRGHHLFGLRMPPGVDLRALRDALSRRRIGVSLRGNALRLAPHVYNDEDDVAALREVLRDAVLRS